MPITRRHFLYGASTLGISALAMSQLLSHFLVDKKLKQSSKIMGGRNAAMPGFRAESNYSIDAFSQKSVYRIDPLHQVFQIIDTKVPGHVVEPHPLDFELAAVIPRRADALSFVDWKKSKEIVVHRLEDAFLYGHAAFTEDGQSILATGLNKKDNQGRIFQFKVPSLKLQNAYSLGPGSPHDIIAIGPELFVFGLYNSEVPNRPQFGLLDTSTGRTELLPGPSLSTETIPISYGHLKRHGDSIYAGFNQLENELQRGGISIFNFNSRTSEILIPLGQFNISNEILSLEFDPEFQNLWFTVPNQDNLYVWSMRKNSLLRTIKAPSKVKSISLLTSINAIAVGSADGFIGYDRETAERLDSFDHLWPANFFYGMSSSHSRISA